MFNVQEFRYIYVQTVRRAVNILIFFIYVSKYLPNVIFRNANINAQLANINAQRANVTGSINW